ncbi:MAG: hypothetical protein D6738_01095 [Acidobacteria bacterium]|nr:MAG: hypothetical protein D6738_01095 [Acidobacteriota bacterium]
MPRGTSGLRWLAATLLAVALAGAAFAQVSVPAERVPGAPAPAERIAAARALAAALTGDEAPLSPAGLLVRIAPDRLDALHRAPVTPGPLQVGLTEPVGARVALTPRLAARARGGAVAAGAGVAHVVGDRLVWYTIIRAPGAAGLRLHLEDLALPGGSEIYVYTEAGEAFGPYRPETAGESGLWTHSLRGDALRLQVRIPADALRAAAGSSRFGFDIGEIGFLGERWAGLFGDQAGQNDAGCPANASCVENASCVSIPSAIQPAQDAVGRMLYSSGGGQFLCSGGLLNDTDTSTTIPYFLTANHCISTQSEASSLEVYFQYTAPCGGPCQSPGANGEPRVLGSTLLSSSSSSDYTLLQLDQPAPAGSTLLGWTTSAVAFANGTPLYRISHPKGQPQAYSEHVVDTSKGTCASWPRGDWIYSRDTLGATEGGSSGSPVLNASGQVVGQLSGACGTNPNNPCASNANATVDGAFAAYYSQISQWLDPGPGNCHNGSNGSGSYCSTSCKCDAGEGDCDSDAECNAGLVCSTDVGPNYGFASWVDVCEVPDCHVGSPGSGSYCSTSCKCDAGEGDCDSDAECNAGLTCVSNVGPNYGWASWVDVCEESGGGSDPNSCVGHCGTQAPGGCWCDSACSFYGDCCPDKTSVCG